MQNTGRLKGADIKKLCMGGLPYLFGQRLTDGAASDALDAIFTALQLALEMSSDVDSHSEGKLHADYVANRTKMAECLCKFEKGAPQSELCILAHELLHFPDVVYRWNNVRNYWVFFSERSTNCKLVYNNR